VRSSATELSDNDVGPFAALSLFFTTSDESNWLDTADFLQRNRFLKAKEFHVPNSCSLGETKRDSGIDRRSLNASIDSIHAVHVMDY